jgi:hypothetical protein
MSASGLREAIESVVGMQTERSIVLTGLYLSSDHLRLVQADLEPDNPEVGAIGRYQNVPVFLDAGQPPRDQQDIAPIESHHGIVFRYVQLDVVN